jgi:hypothetical protein
MAEGRTLWQRLCDWWNPPPPPPPPVEQQHYNPLNAKLRETSGMTVDTLELRKYTLTVQRMKEFKLDYKDQSFAFTDYYLRSTLQEGDPINVKLRVYPHDTPGRELQVLVLTQWDELDYDEDFKALLEDQQFNTMVDDKVEAEFWRINDVKSPYQAQTTELVNVAMKAKDSNVKTITGETWYWDYWRETKDEGGTDFKEFLFVEWDKGDTGRFTIWRGEEVPQSRIFA